MGLNGLVGGTGTLAIDSKQGPIAYVGVIGMCRVVEDNIRVTCGSNGLYGVL